MAEELRLRLLGEPETSYPQQAVGNFVYKKAAALLYYLALSAEAHSREMLAAFFWGEVDEQNARTHLRKALSRLRRLVGEHVTITRHDVAFNHDAPYWLDVQTFQERIQGYQENWLAAPATPLSPRQMEQIDNAVALYRGDFLEGFYVRGAPDFEEWVMLQRERLRRLVYQGLQILVDSRTARQEYATAITYANRLLALDPWHEEIHRQLMRLYALNGQRGDALRQYEICRSVLRRELAVAPDPETDALYEQIARGESVAPPVHVPATSAALRLQETPLIGRDRECGQIVASLRQADCRLLTLLGPGGAGKTALASWAASQEYKLFPDGVYYGRLAAHEEEPRLLASIAAMLGGFSAGQEDLAPLVLSYLGDKQLLLVLDDFECCLGDVALLAQLLNRAPGVTAVAASQVRLHLPGEWVLEVGGLPVEASGGETVSDDAVALFTAHARQQVGFALTAENRAAVELICRLVEGIPLAIILASSWVGLLTPQEIAAELERDLDFLQSDNHGLPPRHRSLRAVFDYAWSLLTGEEQAAFCALCALPDPFRREAAQEVGVSLPMLGALASKSTLRRHADGGYCLHHMLRFYGARLGR